MNTKNDLFSTIQKIVGWCDSAREIHSKSKAAHKQATRTAINESDREIVDATKAEIAELKKEVNGTADSKKLEKIIELEKKISTWAGFRIESSKLSQLKTTTVPDREKEAHFFKIKAIESHPFFSKILDLAKAKLAESEDEKKFRRNQAVYLKNIDSCRKDMIRIINEICSLSCRFDDSEYSWLLDVAYRYSIPSRRIRLHKKWSK